MKHLRIAVATLLVATLVPTLTACGGGASSDEQPAQPEATPTANTDPRLGPVVVGTHNDGTGYYDITTIKFCDGTTLVYNFIGYRKGGGAVIPDSPECTAQ